MEESVEQGKLISRENQTRRKRTASSRRANGLDGKTWLKNSISIWSGISKTTDLQLLRTEQSDVRMSCALPGHLADAEHPGPQRRSHRVEQVDQRRAVGPLMGPAAGGPDASQVP